MSFCEFYRPILLRADMKTSFGDTDNAARQMGIAIGHLSMKAVRIDAMPAPDFDLEAVSTSTIATPFEAHVDEGMVQEGEVVENVEDKEDEFDQDHLPSAEDSLPADNGY